MRRWDDIIVAEHAVGEPLAAAADGHLAAQRESWPLLARGLDALAGMKTRALRRGDARVIVQSNPGRKASVHAKVDAAAIAARPCFLCPDNIPVEERGIAYGDLVVLANPFPVVQKHLTVPLREHAPQRLAGRVEAMLDLAAALGPGRFVLYNGPRCGASAPDHFHFQAGVATGLPLLDEIPVHGDELGRFESFGRSGVVLRSDDVRRLASRIEALIEGLATPGNDDEPMLNVVATRRSGVHTAFVFPRARHRPDCYEAPEDERVAISPASLEMMGHIVVADIEHFDRVTADLVEDIYRQVSVDGDVVERLLGAIR